MQIDPLAVIACSKCTQPWLVETRHAKASCPRCQISVVLARRRLLWHGDNRLEGQQAVQNLRAGMATGASGQALQDVLTPRPALPRHDDAPSAAAAKARGIINQSKRAEAIAVALTRLGATRHDEYMAAMSKAGIAPDRREKEIFRMLASDFTFEPQVGHYVALEA